MQQDILIGTMVQATEKTEAYVQSILDYGFESFAITFGSVFKVDPAELAERIMPLVSSRGIAISAISLYGNPLLSDETAELFRQQYARLIDCAHLFNAPVVTGFTGRLPNLPIPDSIPRFKEVWTPLAEQAAARNLKIGFENCPMGGSWTTGNHNIAHKPAAWELMFEALPLDNVGLEWEPCHQMCQLIDPLPQLREWGKRIVHVHGKDANVLHDVVARDGVFGPRPFAYHRTPGFGDCNWTLIISELRKIGFRGAIDIEGWHDSVYKGDLEMTGQVFGLNYLKSCRPAFIPNPS